VSKVKYKYNPETLSYEKVQVTIKDRVVKTSYYLMVGVVFTTVTLFFSFNYIKQLGAKEISRENDHLKNQLHQLSKEMTEVLIVLDHIQEKDDNIYRAIYESEPYPKEKRLLSSGGNPRKYEKYEGYSHSQMLVESRKKLESIQKKLVSQSRSFDEVFELTKQKEKMLRCIPSIQPISNSDLTRIASGFGMRMHPVYKIFRMHTGVDFTAPKGTDIYATGDGVIEKAEEMQGYGMAVLIDHGYGFKTLYAHCSKFKVRSGQKVKRGDIIAQVGSTGTSTAPHLHYEVIRRGEPINPVNYFYNDLTPEEFEKVIEISSRPTQSL
jgi:murein DD-endopeptidase MepM/ murein hydrolase activator NlpD